MSEARKGPSSSPPTPSTPASGKKGAGASSTPKQKASALGGGGDSDMGTSIKVAGTVKKEGKEGSAKPSGIIKLKKPPPKHKAPGNWKEGTFVDQDKKKTSKAASSVPAPSPSPVVNQLDEAARESFATGRPLEDAPDLQMCKHCKKSVLATAAKQHIAACLKLKKEKAQRKKELKEARERAREQQAREEEEAARRAAGGGDKDGGGGDSDSDSDGGAGGGGDKAESAAAAAATTTKKGPGKGGRKPGGKKAEAAAVAAAAAAAAAAGGAGSAAAAGAAAAAAAANKKRKADNELDKTGPKKKKKEEAKPKTAKPKGPVDVERQCGVILPNGQPCARSLTCKSHSMGAKRAVPGRSLPYDMLLAAYQKKNQAKQQKAAIDASAPVDDEDDANGTAVNEDEEAAAVMHALAQWRPQPVVPQPAIAPIRRQYQLARLYEQLHTATNGGRVNIFKVVGYGAQTLPDGHPGLMDSEDAVGEPDVDAMMMMPPAVPHQQQQQQPQSQPQQQPLTSTTPIPPPQTPNLGGPILSPRSMLSGRA